MPSSAATLLKTQSRRIQVQRKDAKPTLQRRDVSRFEQIVAEHQRYVSTLAYRLLGWSSDAEDVVQDVFLAVLQSLDKFAGRASVKTWLTKITINKCRSYHRKNLLRRTLLLRAGRTARPTGPSGAEGPAIDAETCAQVRRAVAQLPKRLREVMVLRYLQELEIAEIAQLLGVRPNAVEVRLHRGRLRLKGLLAELIEG